MYECKICGKLSPYPECRDCRERYQEDVRIGHIPPQFVEAGVNFTLGDWKAIKAAEKYYSGKDPLGKPYSPEARKALVEGTIMKRIRLHHETPKTPEQLKKEADERIKRYSTY